MDSKKFNNVILKGLFLILITVAFVNIFVNPYDVFPVASVENINKIKPKQEFQMRAAKAYNIKRNEYKTIIAGSSRILNGIKNDDKSFYNMGLAGANMEEIMTYSVYALNHQKNLEHLIIGLDFFAFNKNKHPIKDFDKSRFDTVFITFKDFKEYVFSFDSLSASFSTLETNIFDKKPKKRKGDIIRDTINQALDSNDLYKNYEFSNESFAYLEQIIDLAKNKKVKLTLIVNPAHISLLSALENRAILPEYFEWKKRVVEFSDVIDFSGANKITSDAISNEMMYYKDASHYKPNVGNMILAYIYDFKDTVPLGFGTEVSKENIGAWNKKTLKDIKHWQKQHPDYKF